MRGIRQNLKKKHTFYCRAHTNNHVLQEANLSAYGPDSNRKIELFGEAYEHRRAKLLGHIIRADNQDPLRRVTLQNDTAYRHNLGKRRVGKPEQNWIHKAKQHVWENKLGQYNYEEKTDQDDIIYKRAINRIF